MPLGPWPNFASCVAAQKKKGYSNDSAKRICGSIEAKLNKMETNEINKAKWTKAYMDSLPNSAFLIVEAGADKNKSKRHFPVKDKNGKVDAAHVRNALSRIPQSKLPQDLKDKAKAKATKLLAGLKKATDSTVLLAKAKIAKAKLVIKPTNKQGNIVGNIQATGSGSMSLTDASKVSGVKTPKKTKKDNNNSEYTEDTAPPTSTPVQPGRAVETDDPAVGTTNFCSYCGAKNPSPNAEDDVGTGTILSGSRFAGDDVDRVAEPGFDDGKVQDVTDSALMQKSVKLTKADCTEEEQYVLGVVLEPETEDSQKDIYSEAEIRKSAHNYMANHMHIGLQHNGVIDDRIKILESYIAPCNFDLNGQTIKKGTWLLGARILDTELWSAVKKGELTGWSIGGSAVRTEEKAN